MHDDSVEPGAVAGLPTGDGVPVNDTDMGGALLTPARAAGAAAPDAATAITATPASTPAEATHARAGSTDSRHSCRRSCVPEPAQRPAADGVLDVAPRQGREAERRCDLADRPPVPRHARRAGAW